MLNSRGFSTLGKLVNLIFARIITGCQIGLGVELLRGVQLSYGRLGIVIHPRATIGEDVVIGNGVTIGGTTKKRWSTSYWQRLFDNHRRSNSGPFGLGI